ncbi:MAG: transcription antitermination factor NusB [Chlorobi bacterium]|nr:transcription antitermination factor NusB [Chlorobiota bacterium]
MISRRLIRIKVLQIFYAYTQKPGTNLAQAEKELNISLQRTLYLYYALLLLIFDMVDYAYLKIEIAKVKKIPTREDLNPNMRFVNNRIVRILRENPAFKNALNTSKVSWADHENLIKKLYNSLIESTAYHDYMTAGEDSLRNDAGIIQYIITDLFPDCEELESVLEEQSIYWNDELEFILSVLYKFVDFLSRNNHVRIAPPVLFRNKEDKTYANQLLHQCILHYREYLRWIEESAENWDVERIAIMDILIITQGIAEVIYFSDIPTRVTINEYIEIAKYYSTPKSGVFVNGILDRIVNDLRKKNIIKKTGRGLIGEKEIP